jgi:hypothetical protein
MYSDHSRAALGRTIVEVTFDRNLMRSHEGTVIALSVEV